MTNANTDTPRTDAQCVLSNAYGFKVENDAVPADFARDLERESANYKALAEKLAKALKDCTEAYESEYKAVGEWTEAVDAAKKEGLIK